MGDIEVRMWGCNDRYLPVTLKLEVVSLKAVAVMSFLSVLLVSEQTVVVEVEVV